MEGDVQGELAKLAATPPTAQESEVALRSVQRLQKGNAELAKCDQNEMMQLYVAMKRARGETARISAVHMLGVAPAPCANHAVEAEYLRYATPWPREPLARHEGVPCRSMRLVRSSSDF